MTHSFGKTDLSALILGHREVIRLENGLRRIISPVLSRLEADEGIKYEFGTLALPFLGARINVYKRSDHISFFVSSEARPTNYKLCVADDAQKVYLPSNTVDDFFTVFQRLELSSTYHAVILEALSRGSYGVYEKNEPPVLIQKNEDLIAIGAASETFAK